MTRRHSPTVPAASIAAVCVLMLAPGLQGCKGCKSDQNIVIDKPDDDITPEEVVYSNDWGSWLSMDVMPDGSPALAYYDRTRGGLGFGIATITDGVTEWTHEEVDGFPDEEGLDTGDRGKYASMAVAADGTVWVAYQDIKNKSLRYATRSPVDGTWTNGMADPGGGTTTDAGYFASLALDDQGLPVIAHYDAAMGQLRVVHTDGATFSATVVDEGTEGPTDTGGATAGADVGQFAKIRIVSGVEYIAYYDAANGDLKLAWGPSGDYQAEVVDSDGDVGQWPDLMINDGTLRLAYQDVGNQDLKYASGSPGAWQVEVVDSGEYVGADTAIFMNGTYPAVLYFDGRNNDLKQAWRSGEEWQIETVAGDGIALGFHNEVVSAAGTRYAACYDYTDRTVWFSKLD